MAESGQIGWQEAVARLKAERGRAEAGVAVLKRYGDAAAVARGALAYAEAKAEMDGVIAGLKAALAEGKRPTSLPDLAARLERGVAAREAFAAQVAALVPPLETKAAGAKGEVKDLAGLGGALEKLIEAFQALVGRWIDEDRLKRETIRNELDGAIWPDFAAVAALRSSQ